jgi:hypothetical protein
VEAVNDYLCKKKVKAFIVWGVPLYFAIVLTNNQRGRKDILTLVPTVVGILLRFVLRAEFIEVLVLSLSKYQDKMKNRTFSTLLFFKDHLRRNAQGNAFDCLAMFGFKQSTSNQVNAQGASKKCPCLNNIDRFRFTFY